MVPTEIRDSMELLLEASLGEYSLDTLVEEVRISAKETGIGSFDKEELNGVFRELLNANQVYIEKGKCYHIENPYNS